MGNVAIFKGKLVKFLAKAGILIPKRATTDRSLTPEQGETAFNTTDSKLEVYDGSTWVQLGAGGGAGTGLSHPTFGSTFESGTNNPTMTGGNNTAIGLGALPSVTSGEFNVVIGSYSGESLTTGYENVIVGSVAGNAIDNDGFYNVVVGSWALSGTPVNVQRITAIGAYSGSNIKSGSDAATMIGDGAGTNSELVATIAIGSGAGSSSTAFASTFIGLGSSASLLVNYNTIIAVQYSATQFDGVIAIGNDNEGTPAPQATENNQFILGTSNHKYILSGVVRTRLALGPTGTSTGQTGTLQLRELAANGTNSVSLRAPDSIAADVTWTLPATDGTSGQVLSTNGTGTLSWATAGGSLDPAQTITTAGYALSSTALNTQTVSYTLQSTDNGRIVIMNSSSSVNVTVPSGLDIGFNCMVVQIGTGQVTMVASGTTLNSSAGLKISAQHGALSIVSYASNVFNVSGNTTV